MPKEALRAFRQEKRTQVLHAATAEYPQLVPGSEHNHLQPDTADHNTRETTMVASRSEPLATITL